MNLEDVTWISTRNAQKLNSLGIYSTRDLLKAGRNERRRIALASAMTVTRRKVLHWVQCADLSRVRGIGCDYVAMLHRAKVQTLDDLASQNEKELASQLTEVNDLYRMVKRIPAKSSVSAWIVSAQELKRVVRYEQ